jgi:2-(S-pantetheinyl)-carbapenam-3-carboxylate methyltransferase
MTRRKIYFCGVNRAVHLPLVWGCLRAYAETIPAIRENYSFEEPFFFLGQRDTLVDSLREPYVFLISCYIWNIRKNLEIARQVKERYPHAIIVAGGPQVPDKPEALFAEAPYLDFAIHNEGELPLSQLLLELLKDQPDYSGVSALSWRGPDGQVRTNAMKDRLPMEINVPSPYLEGYFEHSIEAARSAGLDPIVLWETNRGCPYSCTFCDWGSANMTKLRRFPVERLSREIDYFAQKRIRAILGCDSNFGILPRDLDLTRQLVARKLVSGYPTRFITSYAKNANDRVVDISKLLVQAEMANGTILAMQSTTTEVLEAVRRSNIPFEGYRKMSQRLKDEGVRTYTEMIVGLPRETRQSWVTGMCKALEAGIHDDVMVYECVLLPNSQLGDAASREKYGLKTMIRPYLTDDMERVEVVIGTNTLSTEDWLYCWMFSIIVQGLHNLGLTRYLAMFLHREGLLTYENLYRPLLEEALAHPESPLGRPLHRIRRLLLDYLADSQMPMEDKLLTQQDMIDFSKRVMPSKPAWLLHEWWWVNVIQDQESLFAQLRANLAARVPVDAAFDSALRFQQDMAAIMLRGTMPDTVPTYAYNWMEYFEDEKVKLQEAGAPVRVAVA